LWLYSGAVTGITHGEKKHFANFFSAIYNFRVKKIAHTLANIIFTLPGNPAGKAARNDSENILLAARSDGHN